MLPGNVEIIDNDRRSDISKRRTKLPWRNFVCGIWQRAFEERVEDRLFDVLHAESPSGYDSDSIAVALDGFVVGELCHNRCLAPAVLCNDLNGTHGDTVDDLCEYAGARDPALLAAEKARGIPQTLRDATTALNSSKMLRTALGDDVVDHYVRAGEWEQEEYDRRVTDWEVARGFERA